MTSEISDDSLTTHTEEIPNFVNDLLSLVGTSALVSLLWYLFFMFYGYILSLELIGMIILFVAMLLLLPYSMTIVGKWFEIWAYQSAAWKHSIPYMNYRKKCPFFQRKYFKFSCRAEQLAPFDVPAFEKCHKTKLWEDCCANRVPSIIEVFDSVPPKKQQELSFILGAMKDKATLASNKMSEVLSDPQIEMETRLATGYALSEMKEESGIVPLISMLGQTNQRTEQTIRAIIARYKDLAIPYLIQAMQECDSDQTCGAFLEIMGKIGSENFFPTIEGVLKNENSGEYSKLNAYYALQAIDTEKAYRIVIDSLDYASEEDWLTAKQVCHGKKSKSFPLLNELLPNSEISQQFYERIGDILADVDSSTYKRLFKQLQETEGMEKAQNLARILKEHTPEEEEFQKLHSILNEIINPPLTL